MGRETQTPAHPLAQRFALHELPGWWAKFLVVPPGKIGVAIDAQGRARTWTEPGRHRVLGGWERLRGRGAGLVVGWVPAEPFAARIQVPYLLSGDGRLLHAAFVARVRVTDPVRFFRQHAVPAGVVHQLVLVLDDPEAQTALSEVTGQYLAEDLVQGIPGDGLPASLTRRLQVLLGPEGLEVVHLLLTVFWTTEKRVRIRERWLRLQEKLQDLETEEKMMAAEVQARLESFLREMEADLGVRVQVVGASEEGGQGPQSLWAAVRALVRGEEVRHPWLRRLLERALEKEERAGLPVPRVSRWWWVPRTLFILAAWVVGLVGTRLIFWWRGSTALVDSWDLLAVLWAFVLGVTLEGVKALYETRERLATASWVMRGYTRVDDLARQNRVLADRVVRRQSADMLRALQDTLRQLRSRVFRQGEMDAALRLKAVEREVNALVEDVQRPDFGRPPYVDPTLHISKTAWDAMLDYDEDLLVHLHLLLERVRRLQERFFAREPVEEALQGIEQGLADFRLRFARRSEALRPHAVTDESSKGSSKDRGGG